MRSYRWDLYEDKSLLEHYPAGLDPLEGGDTWRDTVSNFDISSEGEKRNRLERLVRTNRFGSKPKCPRVFISHRQTDKQLALQVAYAARCANFDYWLDLIDLEKDKPKYVTKLEAQLQRKLTKPELGFLTAAIIEMALLNCTHVVAVMTKGTRGSQWVPYEYGRVKQRHPCAANASAWCDLTTLRPRSLPEYLWLSPVWGRWRDLAHWLRDERKAYGECSCTPEQWRGEKPGELPDPDEPPKRLTVPEDLAPES
jgi:hypothetical protein